MAGAAWAQFLLLIALLAITTPLLGAYLAKVFGGAKAPGDRVFSPVERVIYRACGIDETSEQRWTVYAYSLLAFSFVSVLVLYAQLRLQGSLPFNADRMKGVPAMLSFNTAVSFLTNTNWQNYSGEVTMSHLSQMAGLAFHNFVSAAAGAAVAVALVRGLVRRRTNSLGNFWVDMTRMCIRVLLPLAFVGSLVLVSQGVIQNFNASRTVTTIEGKSQTIPGGPIASQEVIKEAGQNGGGPFNANSSHPYENPNPITNLFEIWLILAIPFAFPFMYGRMVKDKRQGYVVSRGDGGSVGRAGSAGHGCRVGDEPEDDRPGRRLAHNGGPVGGNMEGKEVRFGPAASGVFASSTTGTSTGSINSQHDSFLPIGGVVPLFNMMLGEVSPGGTGSGLYGMLVFALLSVFIAGLMVGRTPEYLGKKIQASEMKLVVLYILFVPIVILAFAGASVVMKSALHSLNNDGPHGLSEIVYAFTSASNNNGSAFAGLTGNTQWFNTTQAICFWVGRFFLMVPVLAIAGSLGRKQAVPPSAGTFPTTSPLFAGLLTGVVLIVVGLTYFPVVALGPRSSTLSASSRRSPMVTPIDNQTATAVGPPATLDHQSHRRSASLLDAAIMRRAAIDSVIKLDPRQMARSPVMFIVEIGSVITTVLAIRDASGFAALVSVWLWFTVLFANFAEAMAEGRGKAQADTLRKTRSETTAFVQLPNGDLIEKASNQLAVGDLCVVEAGQVIPGDGEVIDGIASVDESAITGESAPVIRESGGDRSAVTGGTRVLSDRIVVRVTSKPGETFLDRMIALVEGASRQKTPNEIALNILLAGLTIIFLLATVTLQPFAIYSHAEQTITVLVALLVCLIPTTIGGLLSAIGIAGMDRLIQRNVLAMSGRAVEAAGDCSTLLLDKTGTITLGNRQAAEFLPLAGVSENELADAAQLSSLADETPEGRSIVVLAKERFNLRERELRGADLVAFTAQTRMSGLDMEGRSIRKGATDSVKRWVTDQGGVIPDDLDPIVERISKSGGTPLAVAENDKVLGVVHLKDVVKEGIAERFAELRRMGIRTVMITGDNPLTAAAIAAEAGVDDFLAEATPEDKMALIKKEQAGGFLVAMTGDGTNDAPALAQADVGVAMNTGTQAAKEAGNMVDLDSNPTKLIEIVEIGKQLLITRLTDDLLDRQRRREIFRHHPGNVPRRISRAQDPQHHGSRQSSLGDPQRGDLQCVDHCGAHPARAARRQVPRAQCGGRLTPQPVDLRPRRHRGAIRRHQSHRPTHLGPRSEVMRRQLLTGLLMTVVLTVVFGIVYPLAVTGISQVAFKDRANGSFVVRGGKAVASSLIGQTFTEPGYFHPRPSAAGAGYDALSSGGSNLGPSSDKLLHGVADDPTTTDVDESFAGIEQRVAAYREENNLSSSSSVPVDAVTASASGLDPAISVANARIQAVRVAKARNLTVDEVLHLVNTHTQARQWGVLGEKAVNVATLNLALADLR